MSDIGSDRKKIAKMRRLAYARQFNYLLGKAHFPNQTVAAGALGLTQSTLSRYTLGQSIPGDNKRKAIAGRFLVRFEQISDELSPQEMDKLKGICMDGLADADFEDYLQRQAQDAVTRHHLDSIRYLTDAGVRYAREEHILDLAIALDDEDLALADRCIGLPDDRKALITRELESIPERRFMHCYDRSAEAEAESYPSRLLMETFATMVEDWYTRPDGLFTDGREEPDMSLEYDIGYDIATSQGSLNNRRPVFDTVLTMMKWGPEDWYMLYLLQRMQVYDEFIPRSGRKAECMAFLDSLDIQG